MINPTCSRLLIIGNKISILFSDGTACNGVLILHTLINGATYHSILGMKLSPYIAGNSKIASSLGGFNYNL